MGLLSVDPFESIDQPGVGELVRMAAERGRATKPGPQARACAASTAATRRRSPSSSRSGVDYVSCSPFRVPVARLAAAHAVLGSGGHGSDV